MSSTFRDMQLERDELVKRVFPQIRRLCEQRACCGARSTCGGASPTSRRRRVTCCPSAWPRSSAPVRTSSGCSASGTDGSPTDPCGVGHRTRLVERRRRPLGDGAGDPPRRAQRPSGPRPCVLLPPRPRVGGRSPPRSAHVRRGGRGGQRRLTELRERIRASRVPLPGLRRPDRPRRSGVGRSHRAGRVAVPRTDAARSADAAASIQRAYGASRFNAFVERPRYTAALDELAATGELRCWSPAPPASGRRRWSRIGPTPGRRTIPTTRVIVHHVEADSDAADHRSMVRRIVAELAGGQIPSRDGRHHRRSGGVAQHAPPSVQRPSGRTVVVIDGVDRLDDVDGAPDLRWLPAEIPPNVRLVLTASAARPASSSSIAGGRCWT